MCPSETMNCSLLYESCPTWYFKEQYVLYADPWEFQLKIHSMMSTTHWALHFESWSHTHSINVLENILNRCAYLMLYIAMLLVLTKVINLTAGYFGFASTDPVWEKAKLTVQYFFFCVCIKCKEVLFVERCVNLLLIFSHYILM